VPPGAPYRNAQIELPLTDVPILRCSIGRWVGTARPQMPIERAVCSPTKPVTRRPRLRCKRSTASRVRVPKYVSTLRSM